MGEYQPREWYEETYRKQKKHLRARYRPPWPAYSNWHLRMPALARMIRPEEKVLDVGCGSGILAAVLWHERKHRGEYIGIDWSETQITRAIAGNKKSGHQTARFLRDDILKPEFWDSHWEGHVVVVAEILEHLEDDIGFLEGCPMGAQVLITVPTRDDPSHVRVFSRGGRDAIKRYEKLMEVTQHKAIRIREGTGRERRHPTMVGYHILEGVRR
jgi:SAM-dependent methyltransferase